MGEQLPQNQEKEYVSNQGKLFSGLSLGQGVVLTELGEASSPLWTKSSLIFLPHTSAVVILPWAISLSLPLSPSLPHTVAETRAYWVPHLLLKVHGY